MSNRFQKCVALLLKEHPSPSESEFLRTMLAKTLPNRVVYKYLRGGFGVELAQEIVSRAVERYILYARSRPEARTVPIFCKNLEWAAAELIGREVAHSRLVRIDAEEEAEESDSTQSPLDRYFDRGAVRQDIAVGHLARAQISIAAKRASEVLLNSNAEDLYVVHQLFLAELEHDPSRDNHTIMRAVRATLRKTDLSEKSIRNIIARYKRTEPAKQFFFQLELTLPQR